MPKRRNESRGVAAGAARFAGSLMVSAWAKATRRPVDTCAVLAAVAACAIIAVNALFLQSGSLPTPFSLDATTPMPIPAPPNTAATRSDALKPQPVSHTVEVLRSPQQVVARRNDPIGQLIGMSSRIVAVQRALANYGYGQIKASGVLDRPTGAAIARFEREHNLPVTGRLSDRLVSDLSVMVGHPLD
ncbi:MAG: peptidoglycan-binding domain-containing protein [Xanthobacteraceae bacterium]